MDKVSVKGKAAHYSTERNMKNTKPSWDCTHKRCYQCSKLSCSCQCHNKEKFNGKDSTVPKGSTTYNNRTHGLGVRAGQGCEHLCLHFDPSGSVNCRNCGCEWKGEKPPTRKRRAV